MTPERWQQVKGVLEKVLERAPSERAVFLVQACDGDQALRREVESLLASDEQGRSGFLQSPTSLRLVRGARLGDYEIQSLIGAGGMGEVYRARDLRLRRDVAIKVLPAFVASDPERLRRFELGRAAGSLYLPRVEGRHAGVVTAGSFFTLRTTRPSFQSRYASRHRNFACFLLAHCSASRFRTMWGFTISLAMASGFWSTPGPIRSKPRH